MKFSQEIQELIEQLKSENYTVRFVSKNIVTDVKQVTSSKIAVFLRDSDENFLKLNAQEYKNFHEIRIFNLS